MQLGYLDWIFIAIIIGHVVMWTVDKTHERRAAKKFDHMLKDAKKLDFKNYEEFIASLDPKWSPCDSGPISSSVITSPDGKPGYIFDCYHDPKDATADYLIHTSSRSNGSAPK